MPDEKVVRGGQVRELHLKDKRMGAADIKGLAEALEDNDTLIVLDIEGNDCGTTGAYALAEMLKKNDTLTTLNLKSNDIASNVLVDSLLIVSEHLVRLASLGVKMSSCSFSSQPEASSSAGSILKSPKMMKANLNRICLSM